MADGIGEDVPVDGRALRSVRSRRAVVEAFLDLVYEGEVQPTAQQVAERSGVSASTIFRLFEDLEGMHAEALAAQVARVADLLTKVPPTGPLEERVELLVRARGRLYDEVAPLLRFQARTVATSAGACANQAVVNRYFRDELADLFADELATAPPRTLDAVDALAGWEMWERLRTVQGLSAPHAREVMRGWLVDALSHGSA